MTRSAEEDPPGTPVRETSSLAIASLVLALVWLLGLGSVLAIVLALLERRSIRRSAGARGGDGLAIAGLVVGVVGLVAGVVVVALAAATNKVVDELTPRTVRVPAGHSIAIEDAGTIGIVRVTVYAVEHPVAPREPWPPPAAGHEFAVADMEVCAGKGGSQEGVIPPLFELVFPTDKPCTQGCLPLASRTSAKCTD